jgi:ribosomal protein S18 acetylase RimI-like enzyme
MDVLRVEAQDVYPIRHEVLRPGRPIETAYFEGDTDDDTFHLGVSVEGHLVSVASFFLRSNERFDDAVQYQLRGMATRTNCQGRGLGTALVDAALPILRENQCTLLWCNARESAAEFYRKLGFETIGERFDIAGVGPHFVMFRRLSAK